MIECHEEQLNILEEWIKDKGLELVYDVDGAEYDSEKKTICYSPRTKPKTTVYHLLHECGHYLCDITSLRKKARYKYQREARLDKRKEKSIRWRIEILREEFEAWELGWKLSKQLNFKLDYDDYQRTSSKLIKSYCDWISNSNWSEK